jgi:Lactate racemase N-terminal domain
MRRLPLVSGSRIALVRCEDDDIVLAPPAPLDPIANVSEAVRDALRYPLSGLPLAALAVRGGRATIVVDHPSLPFPAAEHDPRQEALDAVVDELVRLGIPTENQTLLVAGGLERRAGRARLEALLPPAKARRFHGSALVHDCEDEAVVPVDGAGPHVRVAPSLVATDLIVVVSAAETVLHGGPAALLGASDAATVRAARAESLLEPWRASGWELARSIEHVLALRAPVMGVSLLLDHPRLTGRYRGYPYDVATAERLSRSPLRRLLNALPGSSRRARLDGLRHEIAAAGVLAGPPSVAHAEALLRGTELRATRIEEPLDAIVVPVPWASPHAHRDQINPLTAAYSALGLALSQWRGRFPVAPGGTAVLLHSFSRTFGHGPGAPYRSFFQGLRGELDPESLAAAEAAAANDPRAVKAYRQGRAPHPLLPYAEWAACQPALSQLGRVIVAGCRDAGAARALGFVPSHSIATALEMAHGVSAGRARLGVLLAPPYAPLLVGA